VQPGRYWIIAGSDRNNDYVLGDGGESYGAYPVANQMLVIEVGNSGIDSLDFTTNPISSVSNDSIAADNITETEKPDAVQPEFKRLYLPGEVNDGFIYPEVHE
jgi:hypothetical protein